LANTLLELISISIHKSMMYKTIGSKMKNNNEIYQHYPLLPYENVR